MRDHVRAHQLEHPVGVVGFHARPPDTENEMVDAQPLSMSLNLLNHIVYAAQDETVVGQGFNGTRNDSWPGMALSCPQSA